MSGIRRYGVGDRDQVVALWQACELVVPWNVPEEDIATKVAFQPDLFFVAERDGRIVGSVMAGYEGHRGQINYLAVLPDLRGSGLGRQLMDHAEAVLREIGAPKINLQVRGANREVIAFYEALGYRVDDTVNLGKRLDGR
ncbi:MAG: GNAT family acetyltransferase [Deltaproteobacteria bacterium]|nr:GNAT family acetyltransferase [Deltaproteobacteria bacterium]